jgi:hypothetical protein
MANVLEFAFFVRVQCLDTIGVALDNEVMRKASARDAERQSSASGEEFDAMHSRIS